MQVRNSDNVSLIVVERMIPEEANKAENQTIYSL